MQILRPTDHVIIERRSFRVASLYVTQATGGHRVRIDSAGCDPVFIRAKDEADALDILNAIAAQLEYPEEG